MTNKENGDYYKNVEIIDQFVDLLSNPTNHAFITIALNKIYRVPKENRKHVDNSYKGNDIQQIKHIEMVEISDFCETIREYGHIYHYDVEKLDSPFMKIMEGIDEIQKMMNDSWSM